MKKDLPTENCECCGQRITYWISLNRGVVDILRDIAAHIRQKGINAVHPQKEMESEGFNSVRMGNLTQVKRHGLIAAIAGEPGNYAITEKGLDFLRGYAIPRHTKIRKQKVGDRAQTIGHSDEMVTIREIRNDWGEYWAQEGFEVQAGRVIKTPPVKSNPDYTPQ